MTVHYAYDSRKLHQPLSRQYRFAAFIFVLGTVALALNGAQIYGEEWGSETDAWSYWEVAALIVAVMVSLGLLALLLSGQTKLGYRSYRYLNVTDAGIEWMFNTRKGGQTINFDEISYGLQDPRHLILKKRDGTEVWLENYLLEDSEAEWNKFLAALEGRVSLK